MKVEAGYYYRGKRWLREVGNIVRDRVYYADFTGINDTWIENMQRWAKERYTVEEAKAKFPDEVAEIEKAKAWLLGSGLLGSGPPPWHR